MPGKYFPRLLALGLLTLALLTAGCQPSVPGPTPQPTLAQPLGPGPTPEPTQAQPLGPGPTPTPLARGGDYVDWLDTCPREEAGKRLIVSEMNGFCFLYPDSFTPQRDELRPNEVIKLVGPLEEKKDKSMNRVAVVLWVASNGPADVADSAAYAQKWAAVNRVNYGPVEVPQQPAVIGDVRAVVLQEQPGMIPQQVGLVVAHNTKFSLTISPQPGLLPELDAEAAMAWETVTSSIVFFPPSLPREAISSAQACPQPAAGEQLYVNELDGYCFLYPQDFQPVPDFGGRIQGGPNLGNWQGFENIQPALTVGSSPILAGDTIDTPREILAQRSDIDPASVQDQTIGGALSAVFTHTPQGGPWASRQAIVVTNNRMYTILADPWEPQRWPEAMPSLENAWATVTRSMAFFTPWN